MRPQSLLLAAENVPHFVNQNTRARVLNCYRAFHQELSLLKDGFAKAHLRLLVQHSFSRFKFIASDNKIDALVDYAESHELAWLQHANAGSHKDLYRVLQIAYTNYGVKESPLKQILQNYKPICDHKEPAYRLNNIGTPRERTFTEYRRIEKETRAKQFTDIKSRYWQLVKLLLKSSVTLEKPKRKIVIKLEDLDSSLLTVLGTPISLARQANVLKRLYARFLRDSSRPQHPLALTQLEYQIGNKALDRKTRRRLKELSRTLYSVDRQGNIIQPSPFI